MAAGWFFEGGWKALHVPLITQSGNDTSDCGHQCLVTLLSNKQATNHRRPLTLDGFGVSSPVGVILWKGGNLECHGSYLRATFQKPGWVKQSAQAAKKQLNSALFCFGIHVGSFASMVRPVMWLNADWELPALGLNGESSVPSLWRRELAPGMGRERDGYSPLTTSR